MTYLLLCIPFLAVAAGLATWALVRTAPGRRGRALAAVGIAAIVLLALTAVFDSIMIGVGLVAYDPELRSGVTIGLAPIEDFAYTAAAVLALPALWVLLPRRRRPRRETT
ncbi:lycopene cyclase domain-containing protein [Agromyces sp. SYSU T00194]|uniref:lycopene cyclase domain-containing protein n=1 Tax=Agromyces chitinivorans TaxID=3158560 RepID=UPI0033944B04